MAEKKTYKIDKSKEAMSTADWSDVDKVAMRNKIMDAANRDELVKAVYLLVEDGWQDAPSEHLKYPCMMLDGDTFIYNRNALSSALAYAKQNDEQDVVNKIEAIYKKLCLDDETTRKEEAEMEEIKEPVATEAEFTLEEKKEELSEYETDVEVKAEEPDCECEPDDKHDDDDKEEHELSCDELKEKMAQLEKDIEERDNIIMEKDAELEELRKFKSAVITAEINRRVDELMSETKAYMTTEQFSALKAEGVACDENTIDAWSNKVKAVCFNEVKKDVKKNDRGLFAFAAPKSFEKKNDQNCIWDRLENK